MCRCYCSRECFLFINWFDLIFEVFFFISHLWKCITKSTSENRLKKCNNSIVGAGSRSLATQLHNVITRRTRYFKLMTYCSLAKTKRSFIVKVSCISVSWVIYFSLSLSIFSAFLPLSFCIHLPFISHLLLLLLLTFLLTGYANNRRFIIFRRRVKNTVTLGANSNSANSYLYC